MFRIGSVKGYGDGPPAIRRGSRTSPRIGSGSGGCAAPAIVSMYHGRIEYHREDSLDNDEVDMGYGKFANSTTTEEVKVKDRLLTSALALIPPPASAVREFSLKRSRLAAMGNETMAARPDLEKLVGEGNRQMAEDNNRNFARFMETLFGDYTPRVLVETVLWVFRAYRSHGFQTTYWAANLNIWVHMLRRELSAESFEALYPFYHWLIVNIPLFTSLTETADDDDPDTGIPEH